jgi:hypothetical protein
VGGEEKKGKKKEKRKRKEVVRGGREKRKQKRKKKKKERIYGYRGRGRSKMGNEGILGVVKKKKKNLEEIIKNEYLNEIELRIKNRM